MSAGLTLSLSYGGGESVRIMVVGRNPDGMCSYLAEAGLDAVGWQSNDMVDVGIDRYIPDTVLYLAEDVDVLTPHVEAIRACVRAGVRVVYVGRRDGEVASLAALGVRDFVFIPADLAQILHRIQNPASPEEAAGLLAGITVPTSQTPALVAKNKKETKETTVPGSPRQVALDDIDMDLGLMEPEYLESINEDNEYIIESPVPELICSLTTPVPAPVPVFIPTPVPTPVPTGVRGFILKIRGILAATWTFLFITLDILRYLIGISFIVFILLLVCDMLKDVFLVPFPQPFSDICDTAGRGLIFVLKRLGWG